MSRAAYVILNLLLFFELCRPKQSRAKRGFMFGATGKFAICFKAFKHWHMDDCYNYT